MVSMGGYMSMDVVVVVVERWKRAKGGFAYS